MTLEDLSHVERSMIFNPAFMPALRKLTAGLNPMNRRDICRELFAHIIAIEAGESSPLTLRGAVPMMIVVLHLEEGRPLHLTDELLELWISQSEGNPSECSNCGYWVPCTLPRCVLCNSTTVPSGTFNEERAAKAATNERSQMGRNPPGAVARSRSGKPARVWRRRESFFVRKKVDNLARKFRPSYSVECADEFGIHGHPFRGYVGRFLDLAASLSSSQLTATTAH